MLSPNPIGGLSFRIAAMLICITCLFYTAVMRSINRMKLRGRLFVTLLILTLICCLTGVISTLTANSGVSMHTKEIVTNVCKFIYYLTHMAFTPVLAIYIMIVCEVFHKLNKVTFGIFIAPFVLLELAVLTNPLTGFIYVKGDNLYYSRGIGVYIAYTICAMYILFCVALLGRYWKSMNRLQKVAMLYFIFLAMIGTVVQMIITEIVCELIGEALGLMGIMIMIERDDYRLDYKTHALNRTALIHDLKNLILFNRHFYTICVRIENAEIYRRFMGNEGYDFIMAKGADFLRNLDRRYDTYRTTAGNFYIVCPEAGEADVDAILGKMEDGFRRGFGEGSGIATVKVKVLCARTPEELQDVEDIMLLAGTDIEEDDKILYRGPDLDFLLRKIEVERAIVRGLNGDSFKVMYQPIYDKGNRQITSAEALLTLNDKILGEVDFVDFMSVSNETGFVEELEYRMIEAVFKFLKNGVIRGEIGLNKIVIHIMSVQVLKTELIEKVRSCIEEYQVDPGMVIFSISDSIAIQARDILESMFSEFDNMGIRFVLANNDAGLLGLDPQIISKFDGVTIDVKRHFENTNHDQSEIILNNRISMLKQLGKAVFLRGIESEEYYEISKELPGDFISGKYLSDRVNKNELQVKFWHKDVFWE